VIVELGERAAWKEEWLVAEIKEDLTAGAKVE